ncbi:MAG: EAL and GGDEF domain-containing protein [Hydrogenibacillus sp.]|nr:EAL and GGDEF domain-containing protein [Hydrogenibacillus sp.]
MLYIVEKIARERAIEGAAFLSIEQKLFLNVSPAVIHDVTFTSGNTRKMLAARGIDPEQVVFEVTEQQAINDFTLFREVIEHYRRQGFLIAVDDAGAGYASFQTILALKPDYIKLDRSLVAGIDFDPVKQSLLESFVFFAYKVNSRLIAEGVETLGELTQLIRLGVYAAQGYYLARPAHPPATDIPKEAVEHIFRHRRLIAFQKQQQDTIEIIVAPVHTFDHRTITAIVRQYFDETRDGGVVITQGGRVAGLVMREKLMQVLASQYGHSLYSRRPVSLVADPEPLIVDRATPIDVVARLAMARPADKAYDYIIVTDGERLLGTVSIEAILNYLANVKMEAVRLSNPLTGLPGNHAIDLAVRDRIEADRPFALLYVDLDRFKRYNDRFGYQRGDQIILYLAETLKSSTLSFPDVETFIGHIGGDDFILITRPEIAAPLAEEILAAFERGIGFYYQEANATEPSADAEARVTVSIAVVVCERPRGLTTEVLSERAAQVKKRVKQLAGSAYVIERM